ncbi:MAG: sugar ABC transporter permease [Oscillospiraceae bacterium]|nr:sugar ABC transporter permease [Oscillospiraceae bacterium]
MIKRIRNMSYEKKKGFYGLCFLSVWLLGCALFFAGPLIESFYYSFNSVRPIVGGLEIKWLGLDNYARAFLRDPRYRQNLTEALRAAAFKLPIIIIFSMFTAIVINQKFKGRTFARAVFFLPVIIATGPVYAIITGDLTLTGNDSAEQFTTMFEADMVDQLLEFVGVYGFGENFTDWISEITSGILNLVWSCGIQIIIFLSALQGIPLSAKEAAEIEGATSWEFFWKITLPYVSPMILVNIVYTVIDTFRDPMNPVIARILAVQNEWEYGYSAALSWSYFAIVLAALGIIFAVTRKFVWYENE